MKRSIAIALLLLAGCLARPVFAQTPQTWVKVGGPYNSWGTSAPATFRFGYPDSTGKNWITVQVPAGYLPVYPNGSNIPPDVDTLPNPGSFPLEVDVLQAGTPLVVSEAYVWGGTGCETTVTFSIPAAGAPTTSQSACPGDVPVTTTPPSTTTPPATTPPDTTTPPVTTPPVTTPPATTPPATTPPATPSVFVPPLGPGLQTLTIDPGATSTLWMMCAVQAASSKDANGNAVQQYTVFTCTSPSQ